jgi:hypothetical protein
MNDLETFTPAMFDAMRAIGGGAVTAKDIGYSGNTLAGLCDRGMLKAEYGAHPTFYSPTERGLGAIAVLTAPFVPRGMDGKVARIQKTVAEYYGIPLIEMTSARRSRVVARPRQVAMYLARELTRHSLPVIGKLFGDRDHTTVIHAIRTIGEMDENDPKMSDDINHLLGELEDLRG